jgi:hypothetical protein
MALDIDVKLSIYRTISATGQVPTAQAVADSLEVPRTDVLGAFARLGAQRLLALTPDRESIRMAPPFSAVPTQHRVQSGGVEYFANCAWDALGIPAALHRPGVVLSRCEQSRTPLRLEVAESGPAASDWLFHCQVAAAKWWHDIVFT